MSPKDTFAERVRRVREAWALIEEENTDFSTEMFLARVADASGEDFGDVRALHDGEDPDA